MQAINPRRLDTSGNLRSQSPHQFWRLWAALKRRSSTVLHAFAVRIRISVLHAGYEPHSQVFPQPPEGVPFQSIYEMTSSGSLL